MAVVSGRATARAFRDDWVSPERFPHTLVFELDGTIIGDLMVRIEDPWSQKEVRDRATGAQAELGWVLDPAREGHGYATEAVAALLPVCFDGLPTGLGLRRVTALCFADNIGSWRLMERLGMRREAHTCATRCTASAAGWTEWATRCWPRSGAQPHEVSPRSPGGRASVSVR